MFTQVWTTAITSTASEGNNAWRFLYQLSDLALGKKYEIGYKYICSLPDCPFYSGLLTVAEKSS